MARREIENPENVLAQLGVRYDSIVESVMELVEPIARDIPKGVQGPNRSRLILQRVAEAYGPEESERLKDLWREESQLNIRMAEIQTHILRRTRGQSIQDNILD